MISKRKTFLRIAPYFLLAGLYFGIEATLAFVASASDVMSDPLIQSIVKDMDVVRIVKGELTTIDVKNLQRVSVGNPDIADIVTAKGDDLLVIGKDDGETPVFIWDAGGRRTVMVYVVTQSLELLHQRIERLLFEGNIDGVKVETNEDERRIVITGVVAATKMEKFEKIIAPFEDDNQVIVLVNEGHIDDMVQVDLQIAEISTTLFRKLGIDWYNGDVEQAEETLLGNTFIKQTTTVNSDQPFSADVTEKLPIGSAGDDILKVGKFFRSQALVARINAMVEEGKAKVLSNPKLVVVSGEEASFLVGGEVPIRTTTTNQNGVSENVQFKEYGIGMTIIPTIKKEKIDIILNMDITDIDRANATAEDLAFLVRTAQTRLMMDNGETIVLAGMIKNAKSESVRRIPYLSKVPVVGLLFRSKTTPTADEDSELVFSMTPHILRDKSGDKPKPITQVQYQPIDNSAVSVVSSSASEMPKEEMSSSMKDYLRSIQGMIAKVVVYPPEAAELGWEGTVKINLMILSDGTLAFALVEQSSGYDTIDRSALNLIKNLSYPAFPSATQQKEITVNIPIVYAQSH